MANQRPNLEEKENCKNIGKGLDITKVMYYFYIQDEKEFDRHKPIKSTE